MQSSDRVLAQRYAKALFQAARGAGDPARVRDEIVEASRKLRDHVRTFQHPLIPIEDKKAAHRKLLASASETTRRFLDLLIVRKRWGLLALVASGFDRLLDEEQGLVRAQVRSARRVDDAQRDKLKAGLERFTGRKVQLDEKEDPQLLGGLVVKMGDWVLDASLSHRLKKLKEQLSA